jgi:hypothetical protein
MTVLEQPTLIGAQTPRIRVVPPSITSSGPEVCALADRAGLVLDPWQRMVLNDSLGERADGKWAAFESGLMVGRQNGKSAIFEARMLAGLFLFGEKLLIYSAHEFKTAGEIFRRMDELIAGTPSFSRRVKSISKTRGEEGFELTTRQRLRFLARSTGSGRGFSGDLNIWDESQHLGDGPVDALMPTMSARENPQLWYGGSAPDFTRAPCEQITRVRNRALSGESKGLAYFEWSAELCTDRCAAGCSEHDDPGSPGTWAKTNPGLGIRIDLERIEREYDSMSKGGFNRERLSIGNYPTEGAGWNVISQSAWEATAHGEVRDSDGNVLDPGSRPLDPVAFAVEVTPDRGFASVAVAGRRDDGLLHVELIDHRPGTDWVVDRVASLIETWSPCAVALDPGGPASSLLSDFADAEIELKLPKARDAAAAAGQFYDSIVRPPEAGDGWSSKLRHRPKPALTLAVAGATKRTLGDAWLWDRRSPDADISPLVAVTLAGWAFATRPVDDNYDVADSVH